MTTMTTSTSRNKSVWQAEVRWGKRYFTTEEQVPSQEAEESADGTAARAPEVTTVTVQHWVLACFVDFSRPGRDRISFLVNHREGRDITFTDPRGRNMGPAGVTGIWGTRPAPPVVKPRPLSISAFRIEAARLIGAERADEIIRTISSPDFFGPASDVCQRPNASPLG
jgi:hypothetical protein